MHRVTVITVLLNVAVLSFIWIATTTWKCEKNLINTTQHNDYDVPVELRSLVSPTAGKNDGLGGAGDDDWGDPSFLHWPASPVEIPPNWSYETPKFCDNSTQPKNSTLDKKIIVHYHMQHNAGTNFFAFARYATPCATRACFQSSKHCFVSFNEEIEADNIRKNANDHGVEYVSYEVMLPPRFSLPFVSKTAREGLFFTTIVRDPFKRFLTHVRRGWVVKAGANAASIENPSSPFWIDLRADKPHDIYSGDNLNMRWLSGTFEHITRDHINIAKCRLQLFDLVISDTLYDLAIENILCTMNGWSESPHCKGEVPKKEHSFKTDPMQGVDPIYIGAWIERIRPSFEIYDYARLLSYKQLNGRGVPMPNFSEVPSYLETVSKYANSLNISMQHLSKIPSVSLENEDKFHPPESFCNKMKNVWKNNADEVPNVFGIGTIKQGM